MVMKIAGLQKISTIDYPGEICCVIFLWGCNFRCGFCYNPDLVVRSSDGSFSEEEVLDFLKKRVGKLDAVCISGGEPLMSLDFGFVRKIRELGFKIKIDSNGSFPKRLKSLISEGLIDYIAMDVKGDKKDYGKIVNAEVDLKKIEESIKIVNDFSGEFRTTVVSGLHDSEKLISMGKWMGGVCGEKPERIFLQGFKKNKEGMIDSSFMEKDDFFEGGLVRLAEDIRGLFGEVGVRV
jgi:pyruvate formate lyase activating enzyme